MALVVSSCATAVNPIVPAVPIGETLTTFDLNVGDQLEYDIVVLRPDTFRRLDTFPVKTLVGISGDQTLTFLDNFNSIRIEKDRIKTFITDRWVSIYRKGAKAGDTLAVFEDTSRGGVLDTVEEIRTTRYVVANPDTIINIGYGPIHVGTVHMTQTPRSKHVQGTVRFSADVAVSPQYGVVLSHSFFWSFNYPVGPPYGESKIELMRILR